jgi:rhodanese-related sulfurtransferase
VFALGSIAGCSKSSKDESAQAKSSVPTVTIEELDSSLATAAAQPVDANGEQTRKKMGVIPGAVLLTDSDSFQVSELPADKSRPLVFYCANPSCGASHDAASKAITAGYTSVKVLPDGIAGWVKAGKKTASIGS